MKNRNVKALLAASVAAAATVLLGRSTALAQSSTWNGGVVDNNFTTAANWGGVAPSPNNSLTFAGSTRTSPNDNDTSGTQFSGITFASGAAAFTLGGNGITLAQNTGIVNSSSNLQTVNLPLTLAFGTELFNGGSSGLALDPTGGLVNNAGAVAQFQGTVTSTTIANNGTGIIGGWATIGSDWASVGAGNQIVAYTGYTNVGDQPTIANNPGANIGWAEATSNGSGTLNSGLTDINSLNYTTTAEATLDFPTGSTLRLGASGGVYVSTTAHNGGGGFLYLGVDGTNGGTITAGGANNTPGQLVLDTGGSNANVGTGGNIDEIVVSPTIADNGTGAVNLVKDGLGVAIANAGNTYSGGTYVAAGTLESKGGGGLGTGPVYIANGAQAELRFFAGSSGNYSNNFYLYGPGTGGENTNGQGDLRLAGQSGGSVTVSGTINLLSNSNISFFDPALDTTPSAISGQITGNYGLTLGGAGFDGNFGTLTLSNATNNWTGNTTIDFGDVVCGAGNVIPHGVGYGNVYFTGSMSELDLNGNTETINGLNCSNIYNTTTITNNGSGAASLIIGANNDGGSYDGAITDGSAAVSLTKIGTGTEALSDVNTYSGANTYSGGTTLIGGTLVVDNDTEFGASTGALTFGGGTLGISARRRSLPAGPSPSTPAPAQSTWRPEKPSCWTTTPPSPGTEER